MPCSVMLRHAVLVRTTFRRNVSPPSSVLSVFLRSVLQLLVTVNVVSSSLIPFTLMIEVICFFEMSILTRATRHHVPEDGILQNNR
jgi:hypothetical protein